MHVKRGNTDTQPENQAGNDSQWAAMSPIADKVECMANTLRKRIRLAEQIIAWF
jgi:hypothetical protein